MTQNCGVVFQNCLEAYQDFRVSSMLQNLLNNWPWWKASKCGIPPTDNSNEVKVYRFIQLQAIGAIRN